MRFEFSIDFCKKLGTEIIDAIVNKRVSIKLLTNSEKDAPRSLLPTSLCF